MTARDELIAQTERFYTRWNSHTQNALFKHLLDRTSGSCRNNTRVDYCRGTDTSTVRLYGTDIVSVNHSAATLNDGIAVLSDYPTTLTLSRINLVLRLNDAYMYTTPHGVVVAVHNPEGGRPCVKLTVGSTLTQMLTDGLNSMRYIDGVALSSRFSPNQIDKHTKSVKRHVYCENSAGGGMSFLYAAKVRTHNPQNFNYITKVVSTNVDATAYTRASILLREK